MNMYDRSRRRQSKARERQFARAKRRQVIPKPNFENETLQETVTLARDAGWYLRNNPLLAGGAVAAIAFIALIYLLSYMVSGRILPGVQVAGVDVGGTTATKAMETLTTAWENDVIINLKADGEVLGNVLPKELGLVLDAEESARAAKGVGLGVIPFGKNITPVVNLEYLTAQNYLFDLTQLVNQQPQNATYEYRSGEVIGIEGKDGRRLDIALTLEKLQADPGAVVAQEELELVMETMLPSLPDPEPFMASVEALAAQVPAIRGYDPYINRHYTWGVGPEVFINWLALDTGQLSIREDTFSIFLAEINRILESEGEEELRYLEPLETIEFLEAAIHNNQPEVSLRVRYRSTEHVVKFGDRGHSIGRKKGIPFGDIDQFNSGIDWDALFVGQTIKLPSRDVTMPEPPVPHKRIIVDLKSQMLIAYENSQEVFRWTISSGVDAAPTSPGVYQILNHDEVAYGSSNSLCNKAGLACGQWEMQWFMGIYSVVPGLVNGFHGSVLLPNGNWLSGGNGVESTFGCVMSNNAQAEQLYHWAEVGTVVEIISDEFEPLSDLGKLAKNELQA